MSCCYGYPQKWAAAGGREGEGWNAKQVISYNNHNISPAIVEYCNVYGEDKIVCVLVHTLPELYAPISVTSCKEGTIKGVGQCTDTSSCSLWKRRRRRRG